MLPIEVESGCKGDQLPENLQFGGGANASTMTPLVFGIMALAAIMLAILPRKYAPAPLLIATFLVPAQQVLLGGVHFYVTRILVLVGLCRLLAVKGSSSEPLFRGGFTRIDKALCLLVIVGGTAFIVREGASGAFVYQIAIWLDSLGLYFIMRHLLQDQDDLYRLFKVFAFVAAVLGIFMSYEYLTGLNLFSYLTNHQIVPWIRDGKVRARATFANAITAGTFGATLVPLFFLLWKHGKAKLWASIGFVAATGITITSNSSTPLTGYVGGILALCLWPIRKKMRLIRWGIVLLVLGLSVVMKAPVWFVLTRINLAGGNAYDRAILIDEAVRHFSEWWLLGTSNNGSWGFDSWDACNQFVAEGLSGGLAALVLFIVLLWRSFGAIGQCRKIVDGSAHEWLFWSLGAALFSHIIVFLGVDYFDQTNALWLIFLAAISAGIHSVRSAPNGASDQSAIGRFQNNEEQCAWSR